MRLLLCLCMFLPVLTHAQPTGGEVLSNVQAVFDGIEDYTVSLDVTVDIERLKVPPMQATMYFKQPDKVHFESEGFALLPKEGVGFNPSMLTRRYMVADMEVQEISGKTAYVLTLKPRDDKTQLRKAYLTVDPDHWTPSELVAPLFDGRIMRASFRHRRVDGRWLPSELRVSLTSDDSSDVKAPNLLDEMAPMRRQQIPRKGIIHVRYSEYRINTGLSDELFDRKLVQPK